MAIYCRTNRLKTSTISMKNRASTLHPVNQVINIKQQHFKTIIASESLTSLTAPPVKTNGTTNLDISPPEKVTPPDETNITFLSTLLMDFFFGGELS